MAHPKNSILIFCDGACSGNPGPGGWGAIIATPDGQVLELAGGQSPTTNNQMELTAATRSLERISDLPEEVHLYTDSTYVINGITKWIFAWMRKGWKSAEGNDVANREFWEKLYKVVAARGKTSKITWKYVRGHAGVPGNDRADAIAVAYSKNEPIDLYQGSIENYEIPIFDTAETAEPPSKGKSKSGKKTPAFSYLSLVANVVARHATWAECERRVKGQPGAKFKKATSSADEAAILKSWGVGK